MLRALVVDDDENLRQMLRVMFEREGYEVTEACDGREGLRRFVEALEDGPPFDVVTLDYLMPNVNGDMVRMGIEEHCRKRGLPTPPVYMLTGAEDVTLISRARTAGISKLLLKPQGVDDLREEIRRMGSAA